MSADGFHLIRCVAFGGASKPFISRLTREMGVWSVYFSGARRTTADHSRRRAKLAAFVENEEIFILVETDRLDEVMEFCWVQLHMDKPGRGVVYAAPVDMATPVIVPPEMVDTIVAE